MRSLGFVVRMAATFALVACAQGSGSVAGGGGAPAGSGGTTGTTGSTGGSGGTSSTSSTSAATGGADGGASQACDAGKFVTGVDAKGGLVCAAIDDAARTAIDDGCSVYFGWHDSCDACGLAPTKWGYAGATGCANGAGTDDTCTMPSLGSDAIDLFGLNPDGDVNDDDKLYAGFHCVTGSTTAAPGPCGPGDLVTALDGQSVTCTPLSGAVLGYVRESCSLYFGWQDSCSGCTTPPTKWGRANDQGCVNGAGTNDTCTIENLGGETVNLFGLNTDGDVNDDDQFYVGLHCNPPAPDGTTVKGACPPGQFVVGTLADGSVTCQSVAPLVATVFASRCRVYLGWQDSCGGCTTPPVKWGYAGDGACMNGAGANDTCTTPLFEGVMVNLFGLNPDGNVDDNDKLYLGFRCF